MATPASAMSVELIGVGAKERPRMISPTGVADLDFSPAIDGNDDALWDDANSYKMKWCTYSEDEGKKGANNVASLLMHDLKSRGWLRDNDPANSLTVIFDNYRGQNKNNVVLRLAPYLVEKDFFKEVTIAFYVH
jgi:hypothetical protein